MADIFVSYARTDKARVAPLVGALERQGWSVWWDPAIIPGQEFDDRIAEEIDRASAVVVVWTPSSVTSRWVRGEAREAADRSILIPVRFEKARLPIDVRAVHTTDLDDWKEDSASAPFQELLGALSLLLKDVARSPAKAESERAVSVCVLPFANMSGDPEQEYFADGISEDIITDLSKVSSLGVISRNSAFTFKGKHVDLPEVARQLKVTHVLEGSVRKSGNKVRITAQLIDGATNNHVWAERYDRSLDDIFALQDEISQAIVAALKLRLLPGERQAIEDRGTGNVEAYDKYLRARALYYMQGAAPLVRAAEIYREAIALDSGFALAWRGLYSTLLDSLVYTTADAALLLEGLEQASAKIAALAPNAWWAHAMRADQLRQQHKWLESEAAAKVAFDLAPPSELDATLTYSYTLMSLARCTDARPHMQRLRTLDPLSLLMSMTLQAVLDALDDAGEAEAEYLRSKDLPGDREIVEVFALFRAIRLGKDASVIAERKAAVVATEIVKIAGIDDITALMDQPEVLLARLRKAQPDPANQDSTRQIKLAMWAGIYGDHELANRALRRYAVDLVGARLPAIWMPVLHATRQTAGFKPIVRDLGLYDYWRTSGHWGDFARPSGDNDFEIIR